MSEIAGQIAIQVGAHFLHADCGGRGTLLGSIPGIPPANVVILGAGAVGRTAVEEWHSVWERMSQCWTKT